MRIAETFLKSFWESSLVSTYCLTIWAETILSHFMAVGMLSIPHWLLAGGRGFLWRGPLLGLFECLPYATELPWSV